MSMGRVVALAAALVFVSAASGRADDLSEVADDIPDSTEDQAPESEPEEVQESAPEVAPAEVEPADYSRNGIYVGLGGSYGFDSFDRGTDGEISGMLARKGYPGLDARVSVDDTFGMNGQVGFRFHPHFAAEFNFEWLDGFDGDLSEDTTMSDHFSDISVKPWVVSLNMKGYLLTGRYQPYLSAGGGIMSLSVKLTDVAGTADSTSDRIVDFTGRFGGGIDIYLTENFLVTAGASYMLGNGDVGDYKFGTATMGFGYRF
jgi:opacity protein-like surface antigen